VGLLFDGTYESVASNFLFDPVSTRSIHVDIRYMLWNMTEVDGAIHLLREMSIAESGPISSHTVSRPTRAGAVNDPTTREGGQGPRQ